MRGLVGKQVEARLNLLRRLFEAGVGLEELRKAVDEDRLVILSAEQALGGDASLSARELCGRAGMPLDSFLSLRRAHGLAASDPDERIYGERDLDAARVMAGFYEGGLDEDGMLEAARVLGRGMAQLADALGTLFGKTYIKAGITEEELGLRNAQAAREMLPRVTPVLEYALRHHMRERLRHEAVSQAMLEAGELPGARPVAVAFADMVAFTQLGENLDPEDVGGIAGRLGELASECAQPPVRLVKTIGDAAMLVSPDADALVGASLELIEAAKRTEGFPDLRGGAAYGPALGRSGDWYGTPVNLASRLTDAGDAGKLIANRELRDSTTAAFTWTSVGALRLKGIEHEVDAFRAGRS